jgi:putative DNA primase/helicase
LAELIDYLLEGLDKAAKEWFFDWCAYPLQNPGVKMFSAVVIHGVVQGTGKTLVGLTLGRIYGDNYKEIKDDDLESPRIGPRTNSSLWATRSAGATIASTPTH